MSLEIRVREAIAARLAEIDQEPILPGRLVPLGQDILEGRMLTTDMVKDTIQRDLETPSMAGVDQRDEVGFGA